MTSYGEAEIMVSSRIVGRMRVLYFFRAPAIYPRLGIKLGCTLHESTKAEFEPGRPITQFELRGLSGELRLQELADTVCTVEWAGQRRHVRSSDYGNESQIDGVCDLDAYRLERIEALRNGAEPSFWLALWPILTDQQGPLDAGIRPIRLTVPRERWLEFLSSVRDDAWAVLEVPFSASDAARFQAALTHVRNARKRIDTGDYDDAVAACRRSIEALAGELGVNRSLDQFVPLLETWTDERRAKEYGGIISRIKQLAGYAIHDFGQPVTYSRAEARFVVATTEHLLAMVGALSKP